MAGPSMRLESELTSLLRVSWLPESCCSSAVESALSLRFQNHWLAGVVWMGRVEGVLGARVRAWRAGRREEAVVVGGALSAEAGNREGQFWFGERVGRLNCLPLRSSRLDGTLRLMAAMGWAWTDCGWAGRSREDVWTRVHSDAH
jgi:hypothetical protein